MEVSRILVNGKWVLAETKKTIDVHNPATLEPVGKISNCGEADVNAAVAAAKKAQPAWAKMPGVEKNQLMQEISRRILDKADEIAAITTKETGKPLGESEGEAEEIASCFSYYGELGRNSRGLTLPPTAEHQVNFTVKEPFGVVATIAPFNFPLLLMAWKLAPALAAGNTVVAKASSMNPLGNLLVAEAYEGLPPGVVNVVTGSGKTTGELLIRHPDVNMVAFTGSTEAGRHIASVAGAGLKTVNLELGGIDPLIVFEDADLDVAVPGTAWARLYNTGQVCTSAKRIYVVESIAKEFTDRLLDYVKKVRVGDPMKPDTDIGPIISAEAAEEIESQVAQSVKEGAKLLLGGKRYHPQGLKGHYFEPTILTDVRQGSFSTREEIFGPVFSLIVAKDGDDAIRMANDSEYGLGATIFTKSLENTMRAMENIKAGSFWVNDPLATNDAAPFGGMRASGIGRELGIEGLDAFREPKHVHIEYVMERKDYWFPEKD